VSMAEVGAWRLVLRCRGGCRMCMRCASFRRRPSCSPYVDVTFACDAMLSPESSRVAMFGCADGYTVWVWIVSRRIVEPCLEATASR
jgi:hypothetical protein